MNGERLRQVRRLRRLTQTRLAELSGVTPAAISQIESGALQPSEQLGARIASAMGFSLDYLEQPSGPELSLGSLAFRARRSATKRELYEAQAWAEIVLETMLELSKRFDSPQVSVPQLEGEDPKAAAQITRAAIGLPPDRPIQNVTYTLERAGTLVLAIPVPVERRDAFATWTSEPRPRPLVVVCTMDAPGDRLRHSLAHELGHIVLHRGPRGAVTTIENEADQFASEFLMPREAILDDLSLPVTIRSLSTLKPRWGVSVASLIYRSRELGVISERRARSMFIEVSRRWGRSKPEPIRIGVEKPRALRKLAESVYGDPPDIRRFARDFALPMQLAAAIIGSHAARSEVVGVVSDGPSPSNIVRFPQPGRASDEGASGGFP